MKRKSDLVYFGGYIGKPSQRELRTICKHRFPNLTKNWKSFVVKEMVNEYTHKYLIKAEAALAKKEAIEPT